ncbi:MAG: FtsH protease activity modulator HflK [Pseudomonadota bacterium]
MAWNEPDNDDRKNDPWGSRPGKKDQGPPDIDKVVNDFLKKVSRIFGGGKKGGLGDTNNNSNGFSGGILAAVVVIVGLIWVGAGVYTVDEQERGVVLRLGRVQEAVVLPGLHWNPPLIDSVTKINVTRVYDQTFANTMLTEDDNIVDITMTVQYGITDARKYVLEVADPEISLQQAAESAIRHVVGSSIMDDVINVGRELMAQDTRIRLQNYMDAYGTGITVRQVNIAQSQPPQQVRAAFDDVIKAREDNQSYQNEARAYANQIVPEARGFALRQIQEANAYKEQVVAQADGEAQRFEQLLVEYQKAPEVTRQRLYIDAMQDVLANSSKVMVDIEGGGNNMMYLPLDQLIQQQNRRTVPSVSSGPEIVPSQDSRSSSTVNTSRDTPARATRR